MECEIREASAADAPQLAHIAGLTLREAWSVAAFCSLLERPRCRALAARGLPGLVGYVLGERLLDEVGIYSLAVAPGWQQHGLGGRLLGDYLGRMRVEGAARVRLEVRASNQPARALYHRLGFRREGLRPRYYSDGEDALLLGATL
jgi:ribosomal-protein-alanine N-acetyltransferase